MSQNEIIINPEELGEVVMAELNGKPIALLIEAKKAIDRHEADGNQIVAHFADGTAPLIVPGSAAIEVVEEVYELTATGENGEKVILSNATIKAFWMVGEVVNDPVHGRVFRDRTEDVLIAKWMEGPNE